MPGTDIGGYYGMVLRLSYAICGTERMLLRACYAQRGTEIAYHATRSAVLRWRMLLPDASNSTLRSTSLRWLPSSIRTLRAPFAYLA
eukprot:3882917-Rhodomonas_salina.1